MNGVDILLSIFKNEYIIVDYMNVVQENINKLLKNVYNRGFAIDEVIAYATMENARVYIVNVSVDGKTFSKTNSTKKLINKFYEQYNLKVIIGFKTTQRILNLPLEDDKMYIIYKSLADVRCTFCDETSCDLHSEEGFKLTNIFCLSIGMLLHLLS